MNETGKRFLTTKQFSEVSGLSMRMVYQNISNGRIKTWRQNTGAANYLISPEEVDNFVQRTAKRRSVGSSNV
jgi:excisionase family DNA binding protein